MATVIKQAYADIIASDQELRFKIAKATGKSIETVRRWAKEKNEYLLLITAQEAIREHLKLNKRVSLVEIIEDNAEMLA